MKSLRIHILALLLGVLLLAPGCSSEKKISRENDAKEVTWTDMNKALASASSDKRKIVLDIYTDWCGWCKRMDKDTYLDSEVVRYMNEKWVGAKINPEKAGTVTYLKQEVSNAQFCAALGANGYPTTAFFDEDGKLLTSVSGYLGPKDFLRLLKFLGDDIYKTTKWEDYVNMK